MMKDPRVYLVHILECSAKIARYTRAGKAVFLQEEIIQDAVVRNLEIIGEAAKRIDDTYRAAHVQIPWRGMAALRDVLIHQYHGVEMERVWAVVERDLPQIVRAIRAVLPPLEQLEREIAGDEDDQETAS